MKKSTLLLILLLSAAVFPQTEIDTVVIKSTNWEIYGTVMAYDDNTLSFKPLGISKVKEIKNILIREVRFFNGVVRNFLEKTKEKLPVEVVSKPDTTKAEVVEERGSQDIIITDILDDFLLYLNTGELVRLYGLTEISLMDSRKPPRYISYQTYLYLIDKLGWGRKIRIEDAGEINGLKNIMLYTAEGDNFNEKIIEEGYAVPDEKSGLNTDENIEKMKSAIAGDKGIWGQEGLDINTLARKAAETAKPQEEEEAGGDGGGMMLNMINKLTDMFNLPKLDASALRVQDGMNTSYSESLKMLGIDSTSRTQSTMKDLMKKSGLNAPDEKGKMNRKRR
ncbi:hypothetical protein ACFL4T_12590 [candidate division KSB1 bacterium]